MKKHMIANQCLRHSSQGSPLLPDARKLLLMLLLPFLGIIAAMGQSNARVFTYDASGNRIAIGVPVSRAPKKNTELPGNGEDDGVKVTPQPDGHVRLEVRMDGDVKKYSARVFSSSGQMVAKLATTSRPISTINLSDLQPGVYVVDVAIDGRHVTHKVVRE